MNFLCFAIPSSKRGTNHALPHHDELKINSKLNELQIHNPFESTLPPVEDAGYASATSGIERGFWIRNRIVKKVKIESEYYLDQKPPWNPQTI